ncbi:hypothetical protein LTR64_000668 [Lithohypha guttulata]|uniref:uncharacterized protein n=1 Tax=Lithohypha guttulata TaxID=1690604 RepID=UPI002DE0A0C5|nr:hypothetical protein LTR51_005563 [Lithohypha guttulata]
METPPPQGNAMPGPQEDPPVWTYPTRFCRICREDVPATVTLYPPGLPIQFQKPIVEYKNEDESVVTCLTVLFMLFVVFALGFVADPIINIYLDPYDSVVGHESISDIWDELDIVGPARGRVPPWMAHFSKGFISMGLLGFVKTVILNPFHWINFRTGTSWTNMRHNTGRSRAVNISWIAVAIGVASAFVFFYRWVQAFVQKTLQRIGNNIVDTQLTGDDDDLKPPPGWKFKSPVDPTTGQTDQPNSTNSAFSASSSNTSSADQKATSDGVQQEKPASPPTLPGENPSASSDSESADTTHSKHDSDPSQVPMTGSWVSIDKVVDGDEAGLPEAHRQGWSFSNL